MRRARVLILFAIILLLGAAALYLIISRGGGDEPSPDVTPEGVIPSDIVFVAIAAQDIARGTRIPDDGVVMSRMPANMVVETMISGPDEEGIRSRVVDRIARQDIGRGVPITEKMLTESSGDLLAGGSDAALAIPPGYATAIFPPAGIALAAALLWGNPMLFGVLLGSFCMNLTIGFEASGNFNITMALVALGIGVGALIQCFAGAWLIRRIIGFPASLAHEGEILGFMLLGGPLACMINSLRRLNSGCASSA